MGQTGSYHLLIQKLDAFTRRYYLNKLIRGSLITIGAVLAVTILVAPGGLPVPRDVLVADLLLLGVVAVAAVPVFLSGARISRLEGGAFVLVYLGYLGWVVWSRT